MSDSKDADTNDTGTNDSAKKPLTLKRPGKLELKKTVDAGTVKQNFSHGRSKMVAVEVKKKRTYAQDASGKMAQVREGQAAPAAPEAPAAQVAQPAQSAPPAPAPQPVQHDDNLTDSERQARVRALEGSKVRAAEEAKRAAEEAEQRKIAEAEAAKLAAEQAAQIGRDTSELQSHHDLVCRLLLEKKNIKKKKQQPIHQ